MIGHDPDGDPIVVNREFIVVREAGVLADENEPATRHGRSEALLKRSVSACWALIKTFEIDVI